MSTCILIKAENKNTNGRNEKPRYIMNINVFATVASCLEGNRSPSILDHRLDNT